MRGADVTATDIRSGMALILAALCAKGTSRIFGVEHIERGLENMLATFHSLGADIRVVESLGEDGEDGEDGASGGAGGGERYAASNGGQSDYYTAAGLRGYMRKPGSFAVL